MVDSSLPWFPSLILREQLPESAYMHQLLGLNLLFLLSQNRVAEFHTELERLPAKDIQTNVYIKHPVSLEQVRLGQGTGRAWLRWVMCRQTVKRVSQRAVRVQPSSTHGLICSFSNTYCIPAAKMGFQTAGIQTDKIPDLVEMMGRGES